MARRTTSACDTCELSAKHAEETGCVTCSIEFFLDPVPPLSACRTPSRFDRRVLPYEDVLRGVSDGWAAMPVYTPAVVPEAARLPMYSTWYSYHLGITPEAIEKQCRLARALGERHVRVWSCTGECVLDETRRLGGGPHALPIPPAGTAVLASGRKGG